MGNNSWKLHKAAKSLSTAVALVPLASLFVETAIPVANAQPKMNEKMWIIYYKEENKKPIPGTVGAKFPIMEWYYDASSIKSVGYRRYVKTAFCMYRRWEPGERMSDIHACELDWAGREHHITGIDCKNKKFQNASGFMASPEWKKIARDAAFFRLKTELCGS